MPSVSTFGTLDARTGALKEWAAKHHHTSGGISLKPTWGYVSASGKGMWVRFGVHYGGAQKSNSVQWNNGEQNKTKSFRYKDPLSGALFTNFPSGYIGIKGRTYGTNWSDQSLGGTLRVDMVINF